MRCGDAVGACRDVGHASPFKAGIVSGAITHGHPGWYLPAGFLARLVDGLVAGRSLLASIGQSQLELISHDGGREIEALVVAAVDLASNNADPDIAIERLGEGWTGDEALAIALFCALAGDGFETTVRLAANHDGDSDSTAAIAGNIAGALYGYEALPAAWLRRLELVDLIEMVASDLTDVRLEQADVDFIGRRYSDWA